MAFSISMAQRGLNNCFNFRQLSGNDKNKEQMFIKELSPTIKIVCTLK